MTVPDREDVDPTYRFDLTRIYDSPDDWHDACERLETELDALEARAEEPLATPEDLRTLLERTETCYRRKQRLDLYRRLATGVGREATERKHADLEPMFDASVAAVRRRFRDTDEATLDALVADLDDCRRYAESFRTQADHVRSTEVEETVGAFSASRRTPTDVIRAVWQDYDPPIVEHPDGDSVEISGGLKRRSELSDPDRAYRRRVHEAFWGELERFEETLATAFVAKLRTASSEARVRGYDSVRARDLHGQCHPASGLTSALPEPVHDVMLETVRENLGPYHRALDRRRERLGVDDLRLWDLDVPIIETDPPEVEYDSAKAHLLDAFEPLGEDYVERLRTLFEERRIDVYPGEDKGTLARCQSSAADGPFVHASFRHDARTLFVLAHELGHAMHVEHYRAAPTRYATCPRAVGEVPSTLHEILLAEHLVDEGGPLADVARSRLLTSLGACFYRSAMVSAFVHRLARRVERGESVGSDDIRDVQRDVLAEFRSPVVLGDDAGRTWLGRGTRNPYDSYAYVLGATGALVARQRVRDGELTTDAYRRFLRATGRESPVALFERLGCDVTTPDPFECAAAAFDDYVDRAFAEG